MTAKNSRKSDSEQTSITTPVVTDATAPLLLGMSPRQFREAVTRQRIPFMKLGKRTVVFVEDLHALARRNVLLSDAQPEPQDRHNRRLAAATQTDDFWASIEGLDERESVNAILGKIGFTMSDDAHRNFYKNRAKRRGGDEKP